MMNDTLSVFLEELRLEEEAVAARLAADILGLTLRVALNELDWWSYNIVRASEPDREMLERWYLLRLGVARIAKLVFERNASFDVPTITFRRQIELSKKVLETVVQLGFIQHGRRIAETVLAGRCEIKRTSDNSFEFQLPDKLVNPEADERDVTDHYKREATRLRTEAIANTPEGRVLATNIERLLEGNLFVFREHFMGYDADPLLDEYFFQLAWSELKCSEEFDSFNESATFGSIPYLKYLLATAYLISICTKHERYCAAMVRTEPRIVIEDILTLSADRETFVNQMCHALNRFGLGFQHYSITNMEEAWKIYEVLSISRKNVPLLDRPAATLPCIVEFSDSAIVQLAAVLHEMPAFLLRSLRHRFPRDYDTHQKAREGSMQRALAGLMSESFPGFESRTNITIRMDDRILTDIDFVMIDSHYGDVILCQFKFQDSYGADVRAGESRMNRFRDESLGWLSTIDRWIASGESAMRSALRLPRKHQITRTRKLIVGRHHTHSLRGTPLDEDTAFATWPQLFNAVELMKTTQGDFRTINGLFGLLRQHIVGAATRYHQDEEPVEYCLDRIKFSVVQVEIDTTGGVSSSDSGAQ
jgi:hypothetical protein